MAKQVVVQADSISVPPDGQSSLLVSTPFQINIRQDVTVWLRVNDAKIVNRTSPGNSPGASFQLSVDALDRSVATDSMSLLSGNQQGISLKASVTNLDPGTYIASGHAILGTTATDGVTLEVARAYLVISGAV